MERRDFLALAASVPLLAAPVSANDDAEAAPAEIDGAETAGGGTETVTIDVQIK